MKKFIQYVKLTATLFLIIGLFSEIFAIGSLFSRPRFSSEEYSKMWIKSINATIDIQDQISVTHIDQTFFNEMNQSVESIFIFPLPENAMITELVYWVNGTRFVAEIRERQDAINAYNEKLRQWLDPALLEYLGDNLFRLSIVPINPLSEVRTEITYVEPLKYDLGTVNYKFLLNTLELSSKPLETVSVNINAKSQFNYKRFDSPTHSNSSATRIEKLADNHYSFFYGDENFYPDKDLVLEFETIRDNVNFNVLTYTPTQQDSMGEDSFFSLWIIPPDSLDDEEIIPKNIVFTADISSSMEGERISQVKEALNYFLDKLNPADKFNIVTFGTFTDKFKDDLVNADELTIGQARDFILQMYALGLTNIDDALTVSLQHSFLDTTSNNLIFLTDGEPTWGETNLDSIKSHVQQNNKNDVRIFSFGVGESISKTLLNDISTENHGYAKFITSDDSIALVVNNHFTRISKPVLTDVEIDFGGLNSWDQYPKNIGDLFWGSQITQLGLYNNSGNFDVTLKGKIRGNPVEYKQTINFTDTLGGHRFVPRLWAKTKIDHILNLIKVYGESDELIDQIIDLSLRFQILTPYTAFYSDPDVTKVETDENNIPNEFILEQNYPNPFNPETTINYTIPENRGTSHIILKIYNALGEIVRVLVDKEKSPGKYSVIWNGKDMKGKDVPSGVYFYTLKVGDFYQVRKMVLMR